MKIPYGYVYRVRNKINDKTYVGQRKLSLDKYWRQYMGSGVAVRAAIAKYSSDSFTKELLAYAWDYEELNRIEVNLILAERKNGKAQYNLHIGSPVPQNSGGFKNLTPAETEEVYKKLASKNKARHRRNYEETINPHKEAIISLYSEYRNCRKVADELKLSIKHINRFLKESGVELNHQTIAGRIMTENVKKRISEGLKKSEVKFALICTACNSSFTSKSFKKKTCSECSPRHSTSSRIKESQEPIMITNCAYCNREFEHKTNRKAKFCSQKCSHDATKKELPPIEVINKLYWEERLSANKIGAMYSVSGQTIRKYMKRAGIERRDRNNLP